MHLNFDEGKVFNLGVDEEAKSYMLEAARWGKFLAIIGFIGLALMLLGFLFLGDYMSAYSSGANLGPTGRMIYGIIVVAICFYPVYALLKFSNLIKPALLTSNQQMFNTAFRYLKGMFKYYGILMIIMLGLYALMIIFALVVGVTASV